MKIDNKEIAVKIEPYTKVPFELLTDKNISSNEKVLMAILISLTHKHGYAWASNQYLAEKMNVHKHTISKWINNLDDLGYIKADVNNINYSRKIYLSTPRSIPINSTIDTLRPEIDTIHSTIDNPTLQAEDNTIMEYDNLENNNLKKDNLKSSPQEDAFKNIEENKNISSSTAMPSVSAVTPEDGGAARKSVTDNSEWLDSFSHSCGGAVELNRSAKIYKEMREMNEYHKNLNKIKLGD